MDFQTLDLVGDPTEAMYDLGATDGLPVVPPTVERVDALLAASGLTAGEIVGTIPQRSAEITAHDVAVHAVMAGCKDAYFPVVLASVRAVCDPAFNAQAALTSTGGAALCLLVSGDRTAELGMNSGRGALGSGNRANATIGRAVRLLAMNVLGARTDGGMDASALGHPGKFTMCLPEDPPSYWEPLRVTLGYDRDDSTVTVLATEGTRQINNRLASTAEDVLLSFASAMRTPTTLCVGKGGEVVIVVGPEHARILADGGWSRRACQEFLADRSRITPAELKSWGIHREIGSQHERPLDADGCLPTVSAPEDIFLVTAGGWGSGWSAYIPVWAPTRVTRAATCIIDRDNVLDSGKDTQ